MGNQTSPKNKNRKKVLKEGSKDETSLYDFDDFLSVRKRLKESDYYRYSSIQEIEKDAGDNIVKLNYHDKFTHDKEEGFMGSVNELNVILLAGNSRICMKRIIGYYLDDNDEELILVNYETYKHCLKNLIEGVEFSLNEEDKLRIFRNLLEAMLLLHVDGIICLNFSADYIYITDTDISVKICNLTNSIVFLRDDYTPQLLDQKRRLFFPNYMHVAPELVSSDSSFKLRDITYSADIWSLGIVLLQLFTDKYLIYNNAKEGKRNAHDQNYLLEALSALEKNPFIKAIIFRLVVEKAKLRPIIFHVIDNYNKYLKMIKASEMLLIPYKLDQIRKLTKVLNRSEYLRIFNDFR